MNNKEIKEELFAFKRFVDEDGLFVRCKKNSRIETFIPNLKFPLDKIDISGIDLVGKKYIKDKMYDFKLKGKKADISIPLSFYPDVYFTDFDMLVMEAFLNMYIKNCKEDIEEPNMIFSQDIYTMIYGTDKPQEEQIDKVKKSIAKFGGTLVKIDYSNFLENEEMTKKYGEPPVDDRGYQLIRISSNLILSANYTVGETTMYELNSLPLLDIATIVTNEKDMYFTIEPDAFNKVTQEDKAMENNLEKIKFYSYDNNGELKRVNKCMTELTETKEIDIYEKDKNGNN